MFGKWRPTPYFMPVRNVSINPDNSKLSYQAPPFSTKNVKSKQTGTGLPGVQVTMVVVKTLPEVFSDGTYKQNWIPEESKNFNQFTKKKRRKNM